MFVYLWCEKVDKRKILTTFTSNEDFKLLTLKNYKCIYGGPGGV